MSDETVNLAVTADTSQANKALGETAVVAGKIPEALNSSVLDKASERVAKFGEVAQVSVRGAAKAAVEAKISLEQLEDEVHRIQASGGVVRPEDIARLQSLRVGYENATIAAGRARKAQQEVADDLRAATIRSGEFEGSLSSTEDVLNQFSPSLGRLAVSFSALAAAMVFLKDGARAVADATRVVGESFGASKASIDEFAGSIDKLGDVTHPLDAIKAQLSLVQSAVEKISDYTDHIEALNEVERNREQITRRLTAAGVAYEDNILSIANALQHYEDVQREATIEAAKFDQVFRQAVEQGVGISADKLDEKITSLLATVDAFGGDFGKLSKSSIFPDFVKQARSVEDTLSRFGDSFRKSLTGDDLAKFNANAQTFQEVIRVKLKGSLDDANKSAELFLAKQQAIQTALEESAKKVETAFERLAAARSKFEKPVGESGGIGGKQGLTDTTDPERARQIQAQRDELKQLNDVEEKNGSLTAEQQVRYNELKDALFGLDQAFSSHADAQRQANQEAEDYAKAQNDYLEAAQQYSDQYYKNAQLIAESADIHSGAAVKVSEDGKRIVNTADDETIAIGKTSKGMTELSNAAGRAGESTVKLERGKDGLLRLTDATDAAAKSFENMAVQSGKFAKDYLGDLNNGAKTAADEFGRSAKSASDLGREVDIVNDKVRTLRSLLAGTGGGEANP